MEYKCEFCGNTFSNKNNLAVHRKTAKYCITQRGKQSEAYKCVCGKIFTRAHSLKIHSNNCLTKISQNKEEELADLRAFKEKSIPKLVELDTLTIEAANLRETNKTMISKIQQLKEEVNELKTKNLELTLALENGKGQIKVYKERPGTVHNTQYINPKLLNIKCETIPPLTLEHVQGEVDQGKYTYENYIRGEKGLVDFIAALILEDEQRSYVCTDTARNKFHRLIETREWKEDNGAKFLNKIFDSLKDPATIYYKKIVEMMKTPDEQDTGDFLMDKTKRMFFGITSPKSKDRTELFNRIRTEVRKLAAV